MVKYSYASPAEFARGGFIAKGQPIGMGEMQFAQVMLKHTMAHTVREAFTMAVVEYDDSPGGKLSMLTEAQALAVLANLEEPL